MLYCAWTSVSPPLYFSASTCSLLRKAKSMPALPPKVKVSFHSPVGSPLLNQTRDTMLRVVQKWDVLKMGANMEGDETTRDGQSCGTNVLHLFQRNALLPIPLIPIVKLLCSIPNSCGCCRTIHAYIARETRGLGRLEVIYNGVCRIVGG